MTKHRLPMAEHADTLSLKALRELVTGLVERADRAEVWIEKLEAENQRLRDENDQLRLKNARLKIDNQLLRDEIARLKNPPPRPPFRPSGMEKATGDKTLTGKNPAPRPRGPKNDTKRVKRFCRQCAARIAFQGAEIAGLRVEQLSVEAHIDVPDGPPLPSLAIHLGRTKTTSGEQDDTCLSDGTASRGFECLDSGRQDQ